MDVAESKDEWGQATHHQVERHETVKGGCELNGHETEAGCCAGAAMLLPLRYERQQLQRPRLTRAAAPWAQAWLAAGYGGTDQCVPG